MSTGPQFENSDRLTPEQVASVRRALQSVLSSSAFAGSKRYQLLSSASRGALLGGRLGIAT